MHCSSKYFIIHYFNEKTHWALLCRSYGHVSFSARSSIWVLFSLLLKFCVFRFSLTSFTVLRFFKPQKLHIYSPSPVLLPVLILLLPIYNLHSFLRYQMKNHLFRVSIFPPILDTFSLIFCCISSTYSSQISTQFWINDLWCKYLSIECLTPSSLLQT